MRRSAPPANPPAWIKIIDQMLCIGCHACTVACKAEHDVPIGPTRTFVGTVEVGEFPATGRYFQVTRCNQCETSPCTQICPTSAMFRRPDGIVDFDRNACIGCKACMNACPYDAIYMDPISHSAEKCNFCAHRIDRGIEPACVSVCPTQAIIVGDRGDDSGRAARYQQEFSLTVRKPERNTSPRLFYRNGPTPLFDPLVVRREAIGPHVQPTGAFPGGAIALVRTEAPIVNYGRVRQPAWHWPVPTYMWTKAVASGPFLLWALLAQGLPLDGQGWTVSLAVIAFVALLVTALLLVGDLTHPTRFYLLLLRPQWGSWLVRGMVILLAQGVAIVVFFVGAVAELETVRDVAGWILVALSAATAAYTAWLFRQCQGCQLWQSPILPVQLLVQAVLTGSVALLAIELANDLSWSDTRPIIAVMLGATVAQLLFPFIIRSLAADNREVRYAITDLERGSQARAHWSAVGLTGVALVLIAVSLGVGEVAIAWIAAPPALVALWLEDHAFVNAGQSVPLA